MLKYRYLIGYSVDRSELFSVVQEIGCAIESEADIEMVRDFLQKGWGRKKLQVVSFSLMKVINTKPHKPKGASRKLIHESRPEYRRINT